MNPLIQQLIANGPLITGGAWGTELQARGLEAGECPDHWNLTYPDRVEAVVRAYVEAGSQVILTNTFRANRLALERHVCRAMLLHATSLVTGRSPVVFAKVLCA